MVKFSTRRGVEYSLNKLPPNPRDDARSLVSRRHADACRPGRFAGRLRPRLAAIRRAGALARRGRKSLPHFRAVRETANLVRIEPISGPGVCGADFPLKVAALGETSAIGYVADLRPPGSIPNAASQPRWPGAQPSYQPPPPPQPNYSSQPYPPPQPYPQQQAYPPAQPYPPQQAYPIVAGLSGAAGASDLARAARRGAAGSRRRGLYRRARAAAAAARAADAPARRARLSRADPGRARASARRPRSDRRAAA